MKPETRMKIIRGISLAFVIGLTIYLFSIRDRIGQFERYGYPGIFLVSLASNATVIIPVPGVLVTSAMGAIFNPFWVAMVSGLGAGLGELSGYMAGFSGRGVIERAKWHDKIEEWMKKYGDVTILVLAFVPNPLFDVAGISAGILKLPVWRFLLWCCIGKILKMLIFSYGGDYILKSLGF
jgi:membrane protein YqaA with SNARE-associated domain